MTISSRVSHFEFYRSPNDKQWYWRLKANNGQTIADGGEGYKNRQGCLNGIALVMTVTRDTPMRELVPIRKG